MLNFKAEIATILTMLNGSQWATHTQVQQVLHEYQHLAGAAKTPTGTRRVSLPIPFDIPDSLPPGPPYPPASSNKPNSRSL